MVVLAAGSWSATLAPEADVSPVRGQLLRVRWDRPQIQRIVWSERCYLVPWTDGTLLIGATVEQVGFDERVTGGGVRSLLNAASDVLPAIADATFIDARVGLRPATTTGLPLIARSTRYPALVYATGHFRNGILLAPLTAKRVADLVTVSSRHFSFSAFTAARRSSAPVSSTSVERTPLIITAP